MANPKNNYTKAIIISLLIALLIAWLLVYKGCETKKQDDATISALKKDKAQLIIQNDSLKAVIQANRDTITHLQDYIGFQNRKIDTLNGKVQTLTSNQARLKREITQLKNDIQTYTTSNQYLIEALDQKEKKLQEAIDNADSAYKAKMIAERERNEAAANLSIRNSIDGQKVDKIDFEFSLAVSRKKKARNYDDAVGYQIAMSPFFIKEKSIDQARFFYAIYRRKTIDAMEVLEKPLKNLSSKSIIDYSNGNSFDCFGPANLEVNLLNNSDRKDNDESIIYFELESPAFARKQRCRLAVWQEILCADGKTIYVQVGASPIIEID